MSTTEFHTHTKTTGKIIVQYILKVYLLLVLSLLICGPVFRFTYKNFTEASAKTFRVRNVSDSKFNWRTLIYWNFIHQYGWYAVQHNYVKKVYID